MKRQSSLFIITYMKFYEYHRNQKESILLYLLSATAWINCSKSKLKEKNQKDKVWIFPFLHQIMVINITSTEKNLWFLKESLSNYIWLLVHEYFPSVLKITSKAYFVNKNSYQIVKFQLLKETSLPLILFEYWGKKNKGSLTQEFYK